MTPRLARQILSLRRPGGEDDESAEVRKALEAIESDPALAKEAALQRAFDLEAAAALRDLDLPPEAEADLDAARQVFSTRQRRSWLRDPATLAVALGLLILVGLGAWHFLGQGREFPDEALKIAGIGGGATPDQFDQVDNQAAQLQDWFTLKGLEDFRLPPGLEDFHVAGVRVFRFENEAIAQAAITEGDKGMFFYAFDAHDLGIDVQPEKTWRIIENGGLVLAIRQERNSCFLIVFKGRRADMERLLQQVAARSGTRA